MSGARSHRSRYPELADPGWLYRRYVTEGTGPTVIARELGCTTPAVTNALHRHQIPVRNAGGPLPTLRDVPDEAIVRAWHDLGSVEQAAAQFGVSRTILKRRLVAAGVDISATVHEHVARNAAAWAAQRAEARWAALPAALADPKWLRAGLVRGGSGAVAAELGSSIRDVAWAARQHGITRAETTTARNVAIIVAHRAGMRSYDIAEHFRVSESAVSRALSAAGFPDRRRRTP
jgi:hypothetical protein